MTLPRQNWKVLSTLLALTFGVGILGWMRLSAYADFSVAIKPGDDAARSTSAKTRPAWMRGCKLVYLDVGTNVGVQIRKFYEPERYPGGCNGVVCWGRTRPLGLGLIQVFDSFFGPAQRRRRQDVCVFGFEANAAHTARLRRLETCYQKRGWRVKIFTSSLVATRDGEHAMFTAIEDEAHNGWAASALDMNYRHNSFKQFGGIEALRRGRVTTIDLANFVYGLGSVSSRPSGAFQQAWAGEAHEQPPPRVLMKMDIEGGEVAVLGHMLMTGMLCRERVETMYVEWHPARAKALKGSQVQDLFLRQTNLLSTHLHNILGLDPANCDPPTIHSAGDESWMGDGIPLPGRCDALFARGNGDGDSALVLADDTGPFMIRLATNFFEESGGLASTGRDTNRGTAEESTVGSLKGAHRSLCVEAPRGNASRSNLLLAKCNGTNRAQRWRYSQQGTLRTAQYSGYIDDTHALDRCVIAPKHRKHVRLNGASLHVETCGTRLPQHHLESWDAHLLNDQYEFGKEAAELALFQLRAVTPLHPNIGIHGMAVLLDLNGQPTVGEPVLWQVGSNLTALRRFRADPTFHGASPSLRQESVLRAVHVVDTWNLLPLPNSDL